LPFLRFTRDKRGYETTSLVHPTRRGSGRSYQRVLYWFRTPPGVKVGRSALDQDAIKWIEEHNPDIEFDWPKILEAQPSAAVPVSKAASRQTEEGRSRRGRRDRPRPADGVRPPPPPAPESKRAEPPEPELQESIEPEPELGESTESEPDDLELELEPEALEPLAIEQLTHPEAEEKIEPAAMPIEHVGAEYLTRLRARYAELLARIAERGGSPERIDALRAQAESLNPDTWVTNEEVRQGIDSFEPKIRDLRAALGLRRRRRSRRGGRRRRGGEGAPPSPAEATGESSNETAEPSNEDAGEPPGEDE
jgi:hypothetical protein